jgi:hypothetical protein
MGKYDDLKAVSDESLLSSERNRKQIQAESSERFNVALGLAHRPVLAELKEIGRTFFGRGFLFKNYWVEHFRAKDGSLTYLWTLKYFRKKWGWELFIDVRMDFKYPYSISFGVSGPTMPCPFIERTAVEQVKARLKTFLGELESKISAEFDRRT